MVEATPKGSKIKKDRKLIIDFYDVIHCAKYWSKYLEVCKISNRLS